MIRVASGLVVGGFCGLYVGSTNSDKVEFYKAKLYKSFEGISGIKEGLPPSRFSAMELLNEAVKKQKILENLLCLAQLTKMEV